MKDERQKAYGTPFMMSAACGRRMSMPDVSWDTGVVVACAHLRGGRAHVGF